MTDEALSDAKQTLLRALDSITELEEEMGVPVAHVAVTYAIFKDEDGVIHDKSGWNHSTGPAWLIAAMLRQATDSIELSVQAEKEEE